MPRGPLKIGINARTLSDRHIRGFNRYTLDLIRGLKKADGVEIHLFSDRKLSSAHDDVLEDCGIHISDMKPYPFWEQAGLLRECAREGIHLFHAPANLGIPRFTLRGTKRVVTLHDLISYGEMEQTRKRMQVSDLRGVGSFFLSWKAMESADAVFTVSQYSRNKILERYPEWSDKVFVVPNSVDPAFSPGAVSSQTLSRYEVKPGYALYVGGFEARKNVEAVIQVLERLHGELDFVFAGSRSAASAEFEARTAKSPRVRWLGYVPDADLVHLYRGARCTVVPSKDEGFGLQSLESMACGTPVLSSNAASLPEVGGDAVAYFAPDDAPALQELLQRTIQEEGFHRELSKRGLVRARDFSPEHSAKMTLEIYRTVLNQ